ncbi:MAG: CYTH domain-containing protein [Lachnospiraceae bacterium]|nr:CYTH domain-containing protein [Lachnospiraceae bacterium]
MEIERKYLIKATPENLDACPVTLIEQGYLSTNPVVRVRQDGDAYYLTYKGGGMMAREEYNLPLTADSYVHLLKKADGNIITKHRSRIPYEYVDAAGSSQHAVIELDRFCGRFEGLVMAEVEFPTVEAANLFTPPEWFGEEVTYDKHYHNSYLSQLIS